MIHVWRLSEATADNLGLACTENGLLLGQKPLIERLLRRAYRTEVAASRLMPGLATVASALNANDPCLARIAAVRLKIPDLPNAAARDAIEAEDVLIKHARAEEPAAKQTSEIRKASPDDPKRPGWPKGTEGGRGGKFRPKDGSEAVITQQVKCRIVRIAARRALRASALTLLRIAGEGLANFIPFVGFAADAALVADIAYTIIEFRKLATDAVAAIDFVEKGPHSLEDLQVASSGYEEFPSYYEFRKGEMILDIMAMAKVRRGWRWQPVSSHRHARRYERRQNPAGATAEHGQYCPPAHATTRGGQRRIFEAHTRRSRRYFLSMAANTAV